MKCREDAGSGELSKHSPMSMVSKSRRSPFCPKYKSALRLGIDRMKDVAVVGMFRNRTSCLEDRPPIRRTRVMPYPILLATILSKGQYATAEHSAL